MQRCAQILAWSAWAPGLASREAWAAASSLPDFGLLSSPSAPAGASEPTAPAEAVPAMLRRRLSPLGRAAAEAAAPLLAAADGEEIPWVYASRWGDLGLAFKVLREAALEDDVSPAQFSTSVHNAPAALLSIALGHRGSLTALAGGPFSAEAAFEAAVGLLAEAPRVMLLCAGLKPPAELGIPGTTFAFGLLLGRQNETEDPARWQDEKRRGPFCALSTRPLAPGELPDHRLDSFAGIPPELEYFQWLLASDARTLVRSDRHAAQVWGKTGPLLAWGQQQ